MCRFLLEGGKGAIYLRFEIVHTGSASLARVLCHLLLPFCVLYLMGLREVHSNRKAVFNIETVIHISSCPCPFWNAYAEVTGHRGRYCVSRILIKIRTLQTECYPPTSVRNPNLSTTGARFFERFWVLALATSAVWRQHAILPSQRRSQSYLAASRRPESMLTIAKYQSFSSHAMQSSHMGQVERLRSCEERRAENSAGRRTCMTKLAIMEAIVERVTSIPT